jgi:hypothetical protein
VLEPAVLASKHNIGLQFETASFIVHFLPFAPHLSLNDIPPVLRTDTIT